MRYELFYLIGASKEAQMPQIKEEVMEIIRSNGGVFEEKETLEKRKLAYAVKHENQGVYIAQRFEMENSEGISDINTKLNLHSGVLRFIISKAAELPELKTKEERIQEAIQKQTLEEKRQQKELLDKKPTPEESKEPKEAPDEKKDSAEKTPEIKKDESQQDLDKKLEEILNI